MIHRIAEIAKHSSDRERRAEQAERESLLWKKIVFMKDKVGGEFDAFVTGVASFGLFVTLADFFVEGLVPVSALGNDFFVYEEKQHRLRGRSTDVTYRLGDSVRVHLKEIDEVRRRLNFVLTDQKGSKEKSGSSRRRPIPVPADSSSRFSKPASSGRDFGRGARRKRSR
jgi:ribonuclease R